MMQFIKIWWQAIRFHFIFPTFLPVLSGTAYAVLETGQWHGFSFALSLTATICHHIGLNLADDYYDYCHGADVFQQTGKNAYSGGSGVLISGKLTKTAVSNAATLFYLLAVIIGLTLVYIHGINGRVILALGVIGVFSSFYYTAPPLKFAYRGLGELAIWINFGPVLVLGSYYLQTHTISLGAILLSILMGTLIFCVIMANEIPDHKTDAISGKQTLIVRFGKKFGLISTIIGIMLIFTVIITAIIIKIWPIMLLITFLAIPIGYRGIKTLAQTINTNNIHGNEFIIGFSNFLGILLICALEIVLFRANYYLPASIILATLAMLYFLIMLATPKMTHES